jgi:hypothetical protein
LAELVDGIGEQVLSVAARGSESGPMQFDRFRDMLEETADRIDPVFG